MPGIGQDILSFVDRVGHNLAKSSSSAQDENGLDYSIFMAGHHRSMTSRPDGTNGPLTLSSGGFSRWIWWVGGAGEEERKREREGRKKEKTKRRVSGYSS